MIGSGKTGILFALPYLVIDLKTVFQNCFLMLIETNMYLGIYNIFNLNFMFTFIYNALFLIIFYIYIAIFLNNFIKKTSIKQLKDFMEEHFVFHLFINTLFFILLLSKMFSYFLFFFIFLENEKPF